MNRTPTQTTSRNFPFPIERTLLVVLALVTLTRFARANASTPPPQAGAGSAGAAAAPSFYDRLWKRAALYQNEENPVIQNFSFTGRFQLDYAVIDSDQGNHDEWNIRRFRVGAKTRLLNDFTLHGEIEINPQEADPVYERITDLYLAWSRRDALVITLGKHSAPFTMDGWTSSKKLIALDRANLANNLWFPQEYFPGVSAEGTIEKWIYHAGVYSSGRMNKELGEFDGGYFGLGSVGYDFGEALGAKEALLRADYLYNEPDEHNTFTRSLQHVASLNFSLRTGGWGVRSDVTAGKGYLGQSDLWGAMLMPFYDVTDQFQAVFRYTFLDSDGPNGVRLARYENEVVSGRGDEYHEFYLGLNYYLYGHALKLQTGVQYAEMKDRASDGGAYSGWGWTTGLRVSW